MLAIFEKYSQTSALPKSKILPKTVLKPAQVVFDTLVKYLTDDGYEDIKTYNDYYEIFCNDCGFEISIRVLNNGDGSSNIDVSLYGDHKRGRTRKRLKNFMLEIEELF